MANKTIIFSTAAALLGAAVGFIAGYSVAKKQSEEQYKPELEEAAAALEEYRQKSELKEEKEEPVITKAVPVPSKVIKVAKLASETAPGINYTAYAKMKAEEAKKAEAESPVEEDVEETEDDIPVETYEERLEREAEEYNDQINAHLRKKGAKIEVLGNEPIDPDYPEVHYPVEELYYFTEDDCVCDENGEVIVEEEVIGDKLRKFGWMLNEQEKVYVRNNPAQTDYLVNKIKDYHDRWFNQ